MAAVFPTRKAAVAYTLRMTDTSTPSPSSSESNPNAIREVAPILLPDGTLPRGVTGAPHLLRVTTPDGERVIREWEATTSEDRIAFTADALAAGHAAGITTLPEILPVDDQGARSLLHGGQRFSVFTWIEGRPFARYGSYRTPAGDTVDIPMPQATPSEATILAAARELGKFHVATRHLAEDPRATKATVRDFLNTTRRQWAHDRRVLGDKAANSVEIRRWLRCGNSVMNAAEERISPTSPIALDTSAVVHGDLWPTHLIMAGHGTEQTLVGITGWENVTVGSPVIDLMQLAVHVRGWSAALAEELVGTYHDVAPLTPEERRSLPVVAALDLVTRVARLLHLSLIDDSMIGHESTPILRGAINTLLPSLEVLSGVLTPREPHRFQPARLGAPNRDGAAGGRSGGARRFGPGSTRPTRTGSPDRSRPTTPRGKPKAR